MENNIKGVTPKLLGEIKASSARYNLINNGDHIVFALSGGPDSVCLFFALYLLKDEFDLTLSAVHVNHKFRPGAAEEDQEYVEKLCEKLGVRCRSVVKDCGEIARSLGITSEEAGRRVRYEAFDEEAAYIEEVSGKTHDRIKIAVAHNAQDQAETVLFRLIRGTGTDGLSGIERKRLSEKGYTIIRPILGVEREDIEAFCNEHDLKPHIDHTNLEPIYSRNKIRLGLIPYISENFNENITEALNRLAAIAGEDKDYLRIKTDEAFSDALVSESGKNGDIETKHIEDIDIENTEKKGSARETKKTEIVLSLEKLKAMHSAIRKRVIMRAFNEIGLTQDVGSVHVEGAEKIIARGVTGKTAEFPGGYRVVTVYDRVAFKAPEAKRCTEPDNNSTKPCANKNMNADAHKGALKDAHEEKPCREAENAGTEIYTGMAVKEVPLQKNSDYTESAKPEGEGKLQKQLNVVTASPSEWQEYKKEHGTADKTYAAFDYDLLKAEKGISPEECVRLRTKMTGDYIVFKSGTKKLQDFFVDSKIPRDLREKIALLAVGNEVLWVTGEKPRYSCKYSVSDTTKKVIILELTQKLW